MDEALKKNNLNLGYCYLMIAKDAASKTEYSEFKQVIFKDLEKIK